MESKKIFKQAHNELENAFVYYQMASHCNTRYYQFFTDAAEDEIKHMNKFLDYLDLPKALALERKTTADIKRLYDSADNFKLKKLLKWFLREQREEESKF